jgi:hypothetical protein
MSSTVRKLKNSIKQILPKIIHTQPVKGSSLIWLPQERALECERFKHHNNERHFLMVDYDVYDKETGIHKPIVDHSHYDVEPSFIIYNLENGNHQAYWFLQDPVFCYKEQKLNKPYKYLRAIETAYDKKYLGDKHFSRHISRNPFFIGVDTDWRHNERFSLGELASVVELNSARSKSGNKKIKTSPNGKSSRNEDLFHQLRQWAYRQDSTVITYPHWQQRCLTQVSEYNTFKEPMNASQIYSIAKSVAGYTFNSPAFGRNESFDEYVARTHTSEIQSKRGIRSAQKRWSGHIKQEPWLDMGISKATYYRRLKKS